MEYDPQNKMIDRNEDDDANIRLEVRATFKYETDLKVRGAQLAAKVTIESSFFCLSSSEKFQQCKAAMVFRSACRMIISD